MPWWRCLCNFCIRWRIASCLCQLSNRLLCSWNLNTWENTERLSQRWCVSVESLRSRAGQWRWKLINPCSWTMRFFRNPLRNLSLDTLTTAMPSERSSSNVSWSIFLSESGFVLSCKKPTCNTAFWMGSTWKMSQGNYLVRLSNWPFLWSQ